MSDNESGRRMRERTIQRWERDIRDRIRGAKCVTPDNFRGQVETTTYNLLVAAAKAIGQEHGVLIERLNARTSGGYQALYQELVATYAKTYDELSYHRNERFQIDYATTWDHVKFLIYRFFTAITVAAVVLGTALVADRYGIPLPLIRLP